MGKRPPSDALGSAGLGQRRLVRAVQRRADDLSEVDPLRVATKTVGGLHDGATTFELNQLSIRTAAG